MPQTPDVFVLGFQFTLGAIAALGVVLLIDRVLCRAIDWIDGARRQIAYYRRNREPHWGLPLARVVRWLDRWLRR